MKRSIWYELGIIICLIVVTVTVASTRGKHSGLTDSTITFTQVAESTAHPIKLADNGDGTYSLATTATISGSASFSGNILQLGGHNIDLGAGTGGTGTERVITDTASTFGLQTNSQLTTIATDLGTINTTLGSPMQTSGGSLTANAGTNLNTSALALETGGNLAASKVDLDTLSGAVGSSKVNVNISSGTAAVTGAATGSSVPAGAFYEGGIATTSYPTAATAGNLVGAMYDKAGRKTFVVQAPRELTLSQNTTITSSTAATNVLTAGATGVYNDITAIVFVNSSATGTVLTLSDGTLNYTFYCPATDMRGATFQVPLAESSTATNWTVACTTSVASVYVTVTYVKNK